MNLTKRLEPRIAQEEQYLAQTTQYLGPSADLVCDIEDAYKSITPLVRLAGTLATTPAGEVDWSDENSVLFMAQTVIHRELMMSCMLLTKSSLAALRMHRGESLIHLRKAIESCAFAARIGKHPELCQRWCEAGRDGPGEESKYRAYRRAFEPRDVFPKVGHPDYDPLLAELDGTSYLCSKLIHGSIFGMMGHFGDNDATKHRSYLDRVTFSDMDIDDLAGTFFFVLNTHMALLRLFGRILQPHMTDFGAWEKGYVALAEKLKVHTQEWLPAAFQKTTP